MLALKDGHIERWSHREMVTLRDGNIERW